MNYLFYISKWIIKIIVIYVDIILIIYFEFMTMASTSLIINQACCHWKEKTEISLHHNLHDMHDDATLISISVSANMKLAEEAEGY